MLELTIEVSLLEIWQLRSMQLPRSPVLSSWRLQYNYSVSKSSLFLGMEHP